MSQQDGPGKPSARRVRGCCALVLSRPRGGPWSHAVAGRRPVTVPTPVALMTEAPPPGPLCAEGMCCALSRSAAPGLGPLPSRCMGRALGVAHTFPGHLLFTSRASSGHSGCRDHSHLRLSEWVWRRAGLWPSVRKTPQSRALPSAATAARCRRHGHQGVSLPAGSFACTHL